MNRIVPGDDSSGHRVPFPFICARLPISKTGGFCREPAGRFRGHWLSPSAGRGRLSQAEEENFKALGRRLSPTRAVESWTPCPGPELAMGRFQVAGHEGISRETVCLYAGCRMRLCRGPVLESRVS